MQKSYHISKFLNFLFIVLIAGLALSKALISIAGMALAFLSLFRLRESGTLKKNLRDHPETGTLSLIFGIFLISALYSEDTGRAVDFLQAQLGYLLFPFFMLAQASLIRKNHTLYIKVYVWATLFACGVTLLLFLLPASFTQTLSQRFAIFKDYEANINRVQFGLYSPFLVRLQFSNVIAVASLLSTYQVLTQKGARRWGWLAALGVLLITSLLLGGRGGQLGLFAGLLFLAGAYLVTYVYPLLRRRWGPPLSRGAIALSLLGASIGGPLLLYHQVPALQKRYDQLVWEVGAYYHGTYKELDYYHFTALRRIVSYQKSWELVRQYPLLGTGIGDYQAAMKAAYDRDALDLPVNSHHHWLFVWASCGLWGLLVFLGVLAFWTYRIFPKHPPATRWLALAVLMAFLTIMMFDNLNMMIDQMNFVWYLGLFSIMLNPKPAPGPAPQAGPSA